MASTPTPTPNSLLAGANSSWSCSLDNFPASAGWVLAYYLVKDGNQVTITAAPDGDARLVDLVVADSASWDPGRYHYQAWLRQEYDAHMVEFGAIDIKPNIRA